jgi:diguanylate cyclase (GGDEF)-like protein
MAFWHSLRQQRRISNPEAIASGITPIATTTRLGSILAIVLAVLVAALVGAPIPDLDRKKEASPLELRFYRQLQSNELSVQEALRQTRQAKPTNQLDTQLSTAPVWALVTVAADSVPLRPLIEFPSRHSVHISVWIFDVNGALVSEKVFTRTNWSSFEPFAGAAGFVIDLPIAPAAGNYEVLARIQSEGPATLTARQWRRGDFRAYVRGFAEVGGIMLGSLGMFSILAVVVAFRLRERIYLHFAGWLSAQLASAALSTGHAHIWLGSYFPAEFGSATKAVSLTLVPFFTATLVRQLYTQQIRALGYQRQMDIVVVVWIAMLFVASALPIGTFLPILWFAVPTSILFVAYYIARAIWFRPTAAGIWYAAGLATFFAAGVLEVLHKSHVIGDIPSAFNSVTGALIAAGLVTVSLVEHIAEERRRRLKAQQSEIKALSAFSGLFNRSVAGLVTTTLSGDIISSNPSFGRLLHLNLEEPKEKNIFSVLPSLQLKELYGDLALGKEIVEIELLLPGGSQGDDRWGMLHLRLVDGQVEGSLIDTTDRKKRADQLEYIATHDLLTGLGNRLAFERAIETINARIAEGEIAALLMVDMHRFASVNELYGQVAGDELLKRVANTLRETCPSQTPLFRVAGDTFIVYLDNATPELTSALGHRIIDGIGKRPFSVLDSPSQINLSACVGAIECRSGTTVKEMMVSLQTAVRDAKAQGKGTFVAYSQDAHAVAGRILEVKIVGQFRDQLAVEKLRHFIQPIVGAVGPRAPVAGESLVRMVDDDGKVLPPKDFVGAVERNGLIHLLDRWMFDRSLDWICENLDSSIDFLSLNCSAASLEDRGFIEHIFSRLREEPRAAQKICIEVTESVALYEIRRTRELFHRLRSLGASVALDDFGAGYTSFRYLKELPANIVKIDGEFVKDLLHSNATRVVTASVIELARALGMKSIAEWVEDKATLEALAMIGADYVQGFVIARPCPASDFRAVNENYGFVANGAIREWLTVGPSDAEWPLMCSQDLSLAKGTESQTIMPSH